jgi:hypothetical protein
MTYDTDIIEAARQTITDFEILIANPEAVLDEWKDYDQFGGIALCKTILERHNTTAPNCRECPLQTGKRRLDVGPHGACAAPGHGLQSYAALSWLIYQWHDGKQTAAHVAKISYAATKRMELLKRRLEKNLGSGVVL